MRGRRLTVTQSLEGTGTSKGMSVSKKSEKSRASRVPSSMAWRQKSVRHSGNSSICSMIRGNFDFPVIGFLCGSCKGFSHIAQIQEMIEEDEGHVLPANSLQGLERNMDNYQKCSLKHLCKVLIEADAEMVLGLVQKYRKHGIFHLK